MVKPTNPTLVQLFETPLVPDASHDIYSVTLNFSIPKGSDIEQLLADMMTGKFASTQPPFVPGTSITDVTKIG